MEPNNLREVLEAAATQYGTSLADLSDAKPTLLVFLRHFGCIFCREAVADLAKGKQAIEATGVQLALVHMQSELEAEELFDERGLVDVPRISDPERILYHAFGLGTGSISQLMAPRVIARGIACYLAGYRAGTLAGDVRQMPGVFLVQNGKIISGFVHKTASDRPEYPRIARSPASGQLDSDPG